MCCGIGWEREREREREIERERAREGGQRKTFKNMKREEGGKEKKKIWRGKTKARSWTWRQKEGKQVAQRQEVSGRKKAVERKTEIKKERKKGGKKERMKERKKERKKERRRERQIFIKISDFCFRWLRTVAAYSAQRIEFARLLARSFPITFKLIYKQYSDSRISLMILKRL